MTHKPNPLPCPVCGTEPVVMLGLADQPFSDGQEFVSCPAVFLNVGQGRLDVPCSMCAQGIEAWNFLVAKACETASKTTCRADRTGGQEMSDVPELRPIPDAALDAHHRADAPLTPAEALERCPEVAALVESAGRVLYVQDGGPCTGLQSQAWADQLRAALAAFTKGLEK